MHMHTHNIARPSVQIDGINQSHTHSYTPCAVTQSVVGVYRGAMRKASSQQQVPKAFSSLWNNR